MTPKNMRCVIFSALTLLSITLALKYPSGSVFSIIQERTQINISRDGRGAPRRRAYAKYGILPPKSLIRRIQTGSVTVEPYAVDDGANFIEDEYLSPIYIGTPPQKLMVYMDTGSADLLVFSSETPLNDGRNNHTYYSPANSSTSKALSSYGFNISYGGGDTTTGDLYTDVVKFAGIEFPTQPIEVAKEVPSFFLNDVNSDGYLGIGRNGLGQQTFFVNIAPSLASPLFTASVNNIYPGSYDFGFIDSRKYTGQITYVSALPPPNGHGWWIANATGFYVGSSKTLVPFATGGNQAIIDTGTDWVLLGQQYCDSYYAKASFVVADPDYGYLYPCGETLPDLTLVIGTYEAMIPGALLRGSNLNSTTCYATVGPAPAGSDPSDTPQAIFGDAFLKTTFTVFELLSDGAARLGFASKPIDAVVSAAASSHLVIPTPTSSARTKESTSEAPTTVLQSARRICFISGVHTFLLLII